MTPKQEAFCQAYIETGSVSEAYRIAGYSMNQSTDAVHQNASKLRTKLLPRIEQLQRGAQVRHDVTVDRLTDLLEKALAKAMAEPKGASAAVSAVLGMGKLHGLVVDKKEVTRKRDATDLSESELLAIAAMGGQGAAAQALRENGADSVH